MKKYILTTMVLAAALAFAEDGKEKTIQERVEIADIDIIDKIAESMPEKHVDWDMFKEEMLCAISKEPTTQKTFADTQEMESVTKLLVFPISSPETFTGASPLDLTSSTTSTNSVATTNIIWALEEIDMGYGLDRKPRTMDKSKKYHPGWKRGESVDSEPIGYPYQTLH